MYKILFNMMEEIIKKIEVSDNATKASLEWLSQSKNHGLNDEFTTALIRFLLKKVFELETKIKQYEK